MDRTLIEYARGHALIDFDEMSGLRQSDHTALKAFISAKETRATLKYDKHTTSMERRFIMCGTANSLDFVDRTGDRRYVVVECGEIDLAALRNDRDQLIAQAVAEHTPEPIVLPEHLWGAAHEIAQAHRTETRAEIVLMELTDGLDAVASGSLMAMLDARNVKYSAAEFKDIMLSLGFTKKRTKKGVEWHR